MVDLMVAENTGGTFSQRPGPDFAGVLVKMSLPIFREKRQDRQLAASRQEAMAARHGRDDRLRELTRQAETEYTNLVRLERRLALYRQRAAAEADQTEEAALNAYQNGLIDFESLARARALVLDTQLEMLRIAAEAQKSRANLLYLVGESS
jgi:outer membrane protein TolC